MQLNNQYEKPPWIEPTERQLEDMLSEDTE